MPSPQPAAGVPAGAPGPQRDETAAERSDRNWGELLQELRVTQTGVQILAGFLLTLPFQREFAALGAVQRGVFLGAISLAMLTTALLLAPVSSHRLLFQRHEKAELVVAANVLAKLGLGTLVLTVTCVVLLVFSVVAGWTAATVAAVLMVLVFAALWLVVPLTMLRRRRALDAGGQR